MKTWLVVVALVGCKAKEEKQPEPTPTASTAAEASAAGSTGSAALTTPTASPECQARAKRIGERLSALAKSRPGIPPSMFPAGFALPTSAAGKSIDAPGVTVTITADNKVMTMGEPVPLEEGARLIDEHYYRQAFESVAMGRGPKGPWNLYVYADRKTQVASLAKVFGNELFQQDQPDRSFTPRLLVAGDAAIDPADAALLEKPSVKKVVEGMPKKVEELDIYRAKTMRDAGDPCPSLPKAYVAPSLGSPMMATATMAEALPKALLACDCKSSDPDVWEWGTLHIFGAYQPAPRWIEMPKLDAKDKRTIGDLVK
ncbi:MAG: hypothetical protein ACTHU0_06185 [Kofleriaceae bacterium]